MPSTFMANMSVHSTIRCDSHTTRRVNTHIVRIHALRASFVALARWLRGGRFSSHGAAVLDDAEWRVWLNGDAHTAWFQTLASRRPHAELAHLRPFPARPAAASPLPFQHWQ